MWCLQIINTHGLVDISMSMCKATFDQYDVTLMLRSVYKLSTHGLVDISTSTGKATFDQYDVT